MRKPDPKLEKVESDRSRARIDLLVLTNGFSRTMDILGTEYRNTEDIKYLVRKMDIEITESIRMLEKAEEAYAPYRRRVRYRSFVKRRFGKNPKNVKKVVK